MNVAGILVVVPIVRLADAIEALSNLPGVDVHHTDEASGRIIVTQEAETIREEVAALETIKALPHVVLAEMVHHHFEDDQEIIDAVPRSPE